MLYRSITITLAFLLFFQPVLSEEKTFFTELLPPFSYQRENKIAGPVIEIVTLVCRYMKITCHFEMHPKKKMMAWAEEGKVDGLFSLAKNEDREKWLYFSLPILRTEYGFFVLSEDTVKFSSVADLEGYRVATYGPSNMSETLKQIFNKSYPGLDSMEVEASLERVFKKLETGHYGERGAAFANRDVGQSILQQEQLNGIRYAGAYERLFYYIAFPKISTDSKFVNRFNRGLQTLYQAGRLQAIVEEKYHLEAPKPDEMMNH